MDIRRVALLGGTGFIGRATAERLARAGLSVTAAARHAGTASLPQGVEAMRADVTEPGEVRRALAKADAAAYLPGIVQARSEAAYRALHLDAPRMCATAARTAGVQHFVFVSALGVRKDAPAMADRTKAMGESAVVEAFPGATIVRPSLVLGPGDHFLTETAALLRRLPALPLVGNRGRTRVQPVAIDDMASALAAVLTHSGAAGRIYEIGGPDIFTIRSLMELVRRVTGARCLLIPLSDTLALALAAVLERLPASPLVRDQVRLMHTDKTVGGQHPTLAALGIAPRSVEDVVTSFLTGKAPST